MKRIALIILSALVLLHISMDLHAKCEKGDCLNGEGIYVYPSGSKYVGEFKDGKFHGNGTLYFFNGSSYKGQWKEGKMFGDGELNYANGVKYSGKFEDGKIDAQSGQFVQIKKWYWEKNIMRLLPDDTALIIKFKSLDSVYNNLPITENSFFGEQLNEMDEVKKKIGFNPLLLADLKSQGFDTSRELGFFTSGLKYSDKSNEVDINMFMFIPVTDSEKALVAIKRIIRSEEKNMRFMREGDIIFFEKDSEKMKGYVVVKNKYVLIGMNPGGDAKTYLEKLLKGDSSIMKSPYYAKVKKKINSAEDVFLYMNCQEWFVKNADSLKRLLEPKYKYNTEQKKKSIMRTYDKTLDMMKDYEALAFQYNLENPHFDLKGVATIMPNSRMLKLLKGVKFSKKDILGIQEAPVLFSTVGMNFYEYYKLLMDVYPETFVTALQKYQKRLKTKYNIDLDNEILKNMAGNINLGMFDGQTITQMNYNTMVTINFKNSKMMQGVLDKLAAKMAPGKISKIPIGKYNAYAMLMGFVQLYMGMKKDNLILSLSKPMFEKGLNSAMRKSFAGKIKDKQLKQVITGNISSFYISIDELAKLMNNFPSVTQNLSQKQKDAINKFEYLLFHSTQRENVYNIDYSLKTRFAKPFFKGLAEIIEQIKQERRDRYKNYKFNEKK